LHTLAKDSERVCDGSIIAGLVSANIVCGAFLRVKFVHF
jgi:hypothetical protein